MDTDRDRNVGPFLIFGLIILIVVMCALVPGFADAIGQVIQCSFSPYTCVKVIP